MGVRFGFLSTYPPTQCGIATFTQALGTHVSRSGTHVGVVRVTESADNQVLPVVHQWVRGRRDGARDAALALDDFDVAVIQHEYGIFPGADGEDVLDVADRLEVPVVTVLHTVLTHPTPNQHRVLEGLVRRSGALVTMTRTARERLLAGWDVSPGQVTVIPHGADDGRAPAAPTDLPSRPTVLTWGLLSQGKGVEQALLALAEMRGSVPLPHYRVVGRTHPKVLAREGEAYRRRLQAMTRDLGLERSVTFDDRYLDATELRRVVQDADVVLLPYDSLEQVTSGVLTEAVAAGKPVVSTAFPHAVELLSDGAGLLVPQGDHRALAAALAHVLTVDGAAERMSRAARQLATSLLWPNVAARYVALAESLAVRALRPAV